MAHCFSHPLSQLLQEHGLCAEALLCWAVSTSLIFSVQCRTAQRSPSLCGKVGFPPSTHTIVSFRRPRFINQGKEGSHYTQRLCQISFEQAPCMLGWESLGSVKEHSLRSQLSWVQIPALSHPRFVSLGNRIFPASVLHL